MSDKNDKKKTKKKGNWFFSNRLMEEIKQLSDAEGTAPQDEPKMDEVIRPDDEMSKEKDKVEVSPKVEEVSPIEEMAQEKENASEPVPEVPKARIRYSIQEPLENQEPLKVVQLKNELAFKNSLIKFQNEISLKNSVIKSQEETLANERKTHQKLQVDFEHLALEHQSALKKLNNFEKQPSLIKENELLIQKEQMKRKKLENDLQKAKDQIDTLGNLKSDYSKIESELAQKDQKLSEALEAQKRLEVQNNELKNQNQNHHFALEKNQLESKAQVADLLNRIYEDYPDHATLSEARKTIEISKEMQENSAKEAKAQLDAAKTEAQEIIEAAQKQATKIQLERQNQLQVLNEKITDYTEQLRKISLVVDPIVNNN